MSGGGCCGGQRPEGCQEDPQVARTSQSRRVASTRLDSRNDQNDDSGDDTADDGQQPHGHTLVVRVRVRQRRVRHIEQTAVPRDLVNEVEDALWVSVESSKGELVLNVIHDDVEALQIGAVLAKEGSHPLAASAGALAAARTRPPRVSVLLPVPDSPRERW
jgi:hypothetical protein